MKINEYIEITNEDNMEMMKRFPDNYFDLAIVDPPYRDEKDNAPTKQMRNNIGGKMKNFGNKPTQEYFTELFRVSKNQIIWGGNNFIENLYNTNCFIFWDKHNPVKNYSDGEFAWTSFTSVAKKFDFRYFGNHEGMTTKKETFHPTQKPIALYEWLLCNYAKEGDKILDTHLGSGSIAIALDSVNKIEKMNLTLTACELDIKYYETSTKRVAGQTNWISTF